MQTEKSYRSFGEQALHYFIRDHQQIPAGPVSSPADWRGPQMQARRDEWLEVLSPGEIAEIKAAVDALLARDVQMGDVTRDNFDLPTLAARIAGWRSEIQSGRGFVAVRGLPVGEWGDDFSAYAYWGIGHHLGAPGAQNPQDELLGHVTNYGEEADNAIVRRYRTAGNIDFHCDAADAVGLMCLRAAKSGGQSRIVSSVAIFNALAAEHPDLVSRLFEPFQLDRRDEEADGDAKYVDIAPCQMGSDGVLRTFYHSEYFRSADRLPDVTIDEAAMRIMDFYDEKCLSPDFHLDMWLEPGDMQFISNHTTLHSRTAYEDWPEQERRRHLLRLWLSFGGR